mgnify:CR=1 FL=1
MKKLYRSRKERVIGGVCGGIGVYFGIDPTLIRVIWVAALLMAGTGLMAYIVAWLVIPEEPAGEETSVASRPRVECCKHFPVKLELVIGIFILALGIFLLLPNLGFLSEYIWRFFWPALIILSGVMLMLLAVSKKR